MATPSAHTKLNAVQLRLLRFFSERPVTDTETIDIQRIIIQYYAQKADQRMDDLWAERGFSTETMEQLLNAPLVKTTDAAGH